jgi:hypothetical protein
MDGCSSEWFYWEPYDPDISAAFQRLRERVFAEGNYITSSSVIDTGSRLIIPSVKEKPTPASIEQLLEQEGQNGTHSILDMICVSEKPKRKAICPFPSKLLIDYFGSETPAASEIQEVYDFGSLDKFVSKRWQGIYIVAYFDGAPSDIFFAGSSGD